MIKEKDERIVYLDVAKACLIILVVLGHVLIVLNPQYDKMYLSVIQAFIYTFHMPAFFILHGILLNRDKLKKMSFSEFIKKRVYTLLIPYMFFETLGIIWKAVFCHQQINDGIGYLLTIRCNVGANWFLPSMFIGALLFFVYANYSNKVLWMVSLVTSLILPTFMSENQFMIILGRGLLAYGFILIGNAGKNYFQFEKTKSFMWMSISLVITAIVAVVGLKYGANDMYMCIVTNPLTLIIGGISGTFLVLGVSRILQCKILTYIGKYTLTIMGTHQLIIYALLEKMPQLYGAGLGDGIILLMVIMMFEIIVVYLIEQYLPFCIGRKHA